ncbi:unnamed protein product [Allacma fusca]|uniref:Uncharacterized protein n=1 Tax=Allacma fusca TaxID=39272 RepID=A0A8J2LDJ6_9HEXA|nr:unnamed protein product [Allacma fusca]
MAEESIEDNKEPTPQKITLGFDSGRFVDVVVISLLPFEESEDTSVINMELGLLTTTDHIQDFHWRKKDGILVPDTVQSYDLVSFDVGNNGSIFSTTISRPWLTCDVQDVQFTMGPLEIWWMLDMSNSEEVTNSGLKLLENLEEDNSTLITEDEDIEKDPNEEVNPPPVLKTTTAKALIDKNSSMAPGKGIQDEKEAEVLKSIKDHDFHGPILLSMETLLQNFTYVRLKGCDADKSNAPVYHCPVENYHRWNDNLKSSYYISATSSHQANRKSTEKEPEPCPYFIDEGMTRTLVKALTGRDKTHRSGSVGGRERESRNFSVNLQCHFHPFTMLSIILLGILHRNI